MSETEPSIADARFSAIDTVCRTAIAIEGSVERSSDPAPACAQANAAASGRPNPVEPETSDLCPKAVRTMTVGSYGRPAMRSTTEYRRAREQRR